MLARESSPPPLKEIAKNLAALLVGLGVACAFGEILLAWILPPPLRYRYPQPLHQPDPTLGWVLRPQQRSFTIDRPVTINSLGFRSPEVAPRKSRQGFRVLCLGDSQTFGNGVSQDETYPAVLQSILALEAEGRHVEVLNAGIQGYGISQEVDLLERLQPSIQPDVVTIGFYINDLGDVLRRDVSSIIDAETGEFVRRGLVKRLTPYRLIYGLKRSRLITLILWRLEQLRAGGKAHPINEILTGRTRPEYERAWSIIEKDLERAKILADNRGLRLIVFPVPHAQEFRQEYHREQYRSRLLAVARKRGLLAIDPTPVMKRQGGGLERYFIIWDMHISAATHALIARLLAAEILRDALSLRRRPPSVEPVAISR